MYLAMDSQRAMEASKTKDTVPNTELPGWQDPSEVIDQSLNSVLTVLFCARLEGRGNRDSRR